MQPFRHLNAKPVPKAISTNYIARVVPIVLPVGDELTREVRCSLQKTSENARYSLPLRLLI
jgi:hypothetical protein